MPELKIQKNIKYNFEEFSFEVAVELVNIVELLKQKTKTILNLDDNWDGIGGKAITNETWQASVNFLLTYAQTIFENDDIIIDIPKIYPSLAGSIDIGWETKSYGFLVNISDGGNLAVFYADDKKHQEIEGKFNPHNFNINLLPKAISL